MTRKFWGEGSPPPSTVPSASTVADDIVIEKFAKHMQNSKKKRTRIVPAGDNAPALG